MAEQITFQLALVLFVGIACQWIAWRLRSPAIVLLLVSGIVLGPVAGVISPDAVFGDALLPLVSLSVALILFEGGMTLKLREVLGKRPRKDGTAEDEPAAKGAGAFGLLSLVSVGAAISTGLVAWAAIVMLGFELRMALLLGAVLMVTGPTVIGPLLRTVRPSGKSGTILKWEGILIDPIGAIVAVVLFEFLFGEPAAEPLRAMTLAFVNTLLAGAGIGAAAAMLAVLLLRQFWVPDFLINPVTLALVLGAFSAANFVQHEAGLVAVTVMGVVLSNQRWVRVHPILEFKENLRVLLISVLFVLLAARLDLAVVTRIQLGEALFLVVLILVVRPVSVFVSMALSKITLREKIFLAGVAPRGIVAAAVSAIFAIRLQELGIPDADRLASTTFLVIIATVVVYGFGAMPLAKALGIAQGKAKGFLIAGANPFARSVALTLTKMGYEIVLLDTNPDYVLEATKQGLNAVEVDWLQEEDRESVELGAIRHMLVLTSNDHANRLLATEGLHQFGRANVFQLCAHGHGSTRRSREPVGRVLFGKDHAYPDLVDRLRKGWTVEVLEIDSDATLQTLKGSLGDALALASMPTGDGIEFVEAGGKPSLRVGGKLMVLQPASAEA